MDVAGTVQSVLTIEGENTCDKMKLVVLLLFVVPVCRGSYDDFRRIDSVTQEHSCIAAGGICTFAADCPDGSLAEQRGLCPTQQRSGVECCHGLSIKETRCSKRGGACMKDCSPRLVFSKATDCPDDRKCCILV